MSGAGERRIQLGIFGGTFDPPHVGHLLALSDAADQLALDKVLWVPANAQPLKSGGHAPAQDRVRMVELTVAGDERFEVDTSELDRDGPSFTIDTLRAIRSRHDAELYLIIGADAWKTFGAWREPAEIAKLATIVVLERNPSAASPGVAGDAGVSARRLGTRRIDVTATEIRERVRQGKSIRGFVTESVEAYIRQNALYRR